MHFLEFSFYEKLMGVTMRWKTNLKSILVYINIYKCPYFCKRVLSWPWKVKKNGKVLINNLL